MRLNSPQINLITRACMKASRALIRDFGELEYLQVSSKGQGDFVSSANKRTEKIDDYDQVYMRWKFEKLLWTTTVTNKKNKIMKPKKSQKLKKRMEVVSIKWLIKT